MAVKDNRNLIDPADTTTGWFASSSPSQDTEVFYEGTASIGEQMSKTKRAVLYDTGGTGLENSNYYFLVNCGIVGQLETKAAGGFGVRFSSESTAGDADLNFFEVYVGGSDSWPIAFAGGWVIFVVDINKASESPDATNGTVPAPTAVRSLGITGDTVNNTRNTDNTWIDAIFQLPYNTPGFIIEGTNAGGDYNFEDIISFAEASNNQGAGAFRRGPGGSYVSSVPLQFGNTTTGHQHKFSDTNITLLWDSQEFSNTEIYKFTVEGVSGSNTYVTAGILSGSGDDRVGTQGWVVQAESTANRWSFQANNINANTGLYGCSFTHGDLYSFQTSNTYNISNFYIDSSRIIQSTTVGESDFLKNTIIQPNTAINVAALESIDLTKIKFSNFNFNTTRGGHAIQVGPSNPTTMTLTEDVFTGYSGTTGNPNTALYFANTTGGVTVSLATGTSEPSYRTAGISVTFAASVTGTISNLLEKTEVRVYDLGDEDPNIPGCYAEIAGIENADVGDVGDNFSGSLASQSGPDSNGRYTITFTVGLNKNLRIKFINSDFVDNNYWIADNVEISSGTDNFSIQAAQRVDRVFANPS